MTFSIHQFLDTNRGDTDLGGKDFDNPVLNWCLDQFKFKNADVHKNLQENPHPQSHLRRAVKNAKRAPSSGMSTKIEVDSLIANFDFMLLKIEPRLKN